MFGRESGLGLYSRNVLSRGQAFLGPQYAAPVRLEHIQAALVRRVSIMIESSVMFAVASEMIPVSGLTSSVACTLCLAGTYSSATGTDANPLRIIPSFTEPLRRWTWEIWDSLHFCSRISDLMNLAEAHELFSQCFHCKPQSCSYQYILNHSLNLKLGCASHNLSSGNRFVNMHALPSRSIFKRCRWRRRFSPSHISFVFHSLTQ
jgi:hypothetical protein